MFTLHLELCFQALKAIAEEDGHSGTTVDGSTLSREDAESQSTRLDQLDGSRGEQQTLIIFVYIAFDGQTC